MEDVNKNEDYLEDEDGQSGSSDPSAEDSGNEDGEQDTDQELVPREHYENMKKALQETRGKSRAEIEALRRRVEAYEAAIESLKKNEEVDVDIFKDLKDDDIVTVAGAKKIMEIQAQNLRDKEDSLNARFAEFTVSLAERDFKREHTDFDEVTAPFKDLLKDHKFLQTMLSDGLLEVPRKFYEYCKNELVVEDNTKNPPSADNKSSQNDVKPQNAKPIQKPKTMDRKSRSGDSKIDLSKLNIEQKRRLIRQGKITVEDLDDFVDSLMGG